MGKAGGVDGSTNMFKGIASCKWAKQLSLTGYNQESGTYSVNKNELVLNEYLSDFMHFETIFFVENDFFKKPPTHPTKVWKIPHFFWNLP